MITLTVAVGLTSFVINQDRLFSIARNLEIFSDMFKILHAEYVDDLNPNQVAGKGIEQMLDDLDPYTNFFSEDVVEDIRTMRTGQYAGIGLTTKHFQNTVRVTEVIEGSPAARAGIMPGDDILKLDGVELGKISQEEIEKLIRGQAGAALKLLIQKADRTGTIEKEIKRERITIKTVSFWGMIDAETGYLTLDEFSAESASEVRTALIGLKEKGAKYLVFDLRGNPGGLLDQAVSICGLFLPKGSLVVSNKGKVPENNIQYHTRVNPIEPDIPLAILIDRNSASASEIVSGTLQDYDRAVVIGERSFGKGLVQTRRPLSFNSFSMITTARYYTPSGRCIQALDYSDKGKKNQAQVKPDSLKKVFFTKNGRKVFDSGGIDPDVQVNRKFNPEIFNLLEEGGHFLDFGTEYRLGNPTIKQPLLFELTDAELERFYSWIGKRSVKVENDLEKSLNRFQQANTATSSSQSIQTSLKDLENGIKRFRRNQLLEQRQELRKRLAREIVSRYFFTKGAREATFKYDQELMTATEILKNSTKMDALLAKKEE